MSTKGKRVLLGISGSIAAFKIPQLVRILVEEGYSVRCVMTKPAEKFVSPLVLSTFTGEKVQSEMFGPDAHTMPHLTLAETCDLFVLVPLSTAMLARCAHGLADDLVSLTYLTTKVPVLMVPAMHDSLWDHPASQENVRLLKERGVQFLGPTKGKLADNKKAVGRMVEPDEIVNAIHEKLS